MAGADRALACARRRDRQQNQGGPGLQGTRHDVASLPCVAPLALSLLQGLPPDPCEADLLLARLPSLRAETYLTYTTTLAFYFHLAALPADTRPNLQTHPVLQRLLQLKEALSQMENLDFAGDGSGSEDESDPDEFAAGFEGESFMQDGDDDDDDDDDEADDDDDDDELLGLGGGSMDGKRDAAAEREWRQKMLEGLEEGELEELMAEMARMKRGEGALSDESDDDLDDGEELPPAKPVKKVKKTETKKVKKTVAPAFPTIDEPTPSFSSSSKPRKAKASSSSKRSAAAAGDDDVLAEPTTLSAPDSSAKDAAKHSLRFHTSKIESAASRRASARSGRMGGDDDVPYRNKQAGRDAALRKNSGAGAGNGDGDDLDGEEWGEADRAAAKAVRDMDGVDMVDEGGDGDDGGDAGEGDDGYYQLVKKRKREEKEEKQAAYDEAREEERCVIPFFQLSRQTRCLFGVCFTA